MKNTKKYVMVAMIAAIYTGISLAIAPFSFGGVQVRIAEALTLLPLIYFPSVFGVVLGCFLTNLIGAMTGVNILGFMDAIIGTSATLIAAYLTYRYRDNKVNGIPLISMSAPILVNAVVIGLELGFVFFPDNIIFGSLMSGLQVGIGQFIAVFAGYILIKKLENNKIFE